MGRVKNAGKRITAWLMAVCMILSVMPPIEAKAEVSLETEKNISISLWNGENTVSDTTYTYTGQAIKPEVQVKYQDVELTEGTDYFLSWSNNVQSGTASVTVRGNGNYKDSKTLTFKINPVKLDSFLFSFNDDRVQTGESTPYMFYNNGSALEPNVKVQGTVNGKTIDLTTNDYSLTYDNNTTVSGTPATVTATLKPNGNYECDISTFSKKFNIFYDLSKATLTDASQLAIADMVYSGKTVVPASLELLGNNNEPLTMGTHYTSKNGWTNKVNAGPTSITYLANTSNSSCKYRGKKTVEATIQQYNVTAATIVFDQVTYEYTGTGSNKPDMTNHVQVYIDDDGVIDENSVLVSTDNYTVSYLEGSIGKPGNNWLAITGKNNLTGTKEVQFTIVRAINSATIENDIIYYDGEPVTLEKLGLKVSDADGEISSDNYTVTFYSDSECTEEKKVDAPKTVGTYYLKIEGKNNYTGTLSGSNYKFVIEQQNFEKCKFTLAYGGSSFVLNPESSLSVGYSENGIILKISKGEDAQGNPLTLDGSANGGANGDYTYGIYSDEACTQMDGIVQGGGGFTIKKAGTYYINVEGTGKGNYSEGTQTFTFTVTPKTVVAGTATVTIADQIYTGSPIIPAESSIEVKFTDGSNPITLDSADFEVVPGSGVNNVNIRSKSEDENSPSVQIRLVGNYTLGTDGAGNEKTLTGRFSILPRTLESCQCNLVYGDSNYDASQLTTIYNGKVQEPTIIIMDGEKALVKGTDYNVSYTDKVTGQPADTQNVGTYTITITGAGTYGGTISAEYKITPKTIAGMNLEIGKVPYNHGSAIDNDVIYNQIKLTEGDGSKTLVKETDYTIDGFYRDEACSDGAKIIGNLTDAGRYYVRLTGTGNYTGAKKGSFYVGEDFTAQIDEFDVSGWTYNVDSNGQEVSYYSEIQAAIRRKVEMQNPDMAGKYQIYYFSDSQRENSIASSDPAFKSAGSIYFRVSGTNGYYGYVEGKAVIAKKPFSELKAEILGTYTYGEDTTVTDFTGEKGVKVYSYVSEDGQTKYLLDNSGGKVYTIDNGDAYSNAGEYTITLTAKQDSNYAGVISVKFTIQPKQITSLSALKVTVPSKEYSHQVLRPQVTVTYGESGVTLSSDSYAIELYQNADFTTPATDDTLTNAGTVYVKVIGTGNYTGFIASGDYGTDPGKVQGSNQFIIKPKDISSATVDIEGKDYIYEQGKQVVFKVQQSFQRDTNTTYTVELKKDIDYTYEEPANTANFKVGSQTITLTGQGNYTGTKSFTFNYAGDISDPNHATIIIGDANSPLTKDFTGSEIKLLDSGANPEILVTDADSRVLNSGTDYNVTYQNNIEPGKATVIITGNSNAHWYGTVEKTFTIIGDLKLADTEITIPDQVYTGNAYGTLTQPIQNMVVKFHGRVLVPGQDYNVATVTDGIEVSNNGAKVTIEAVNGSFFKGSKEANFSIKYNSSNLNIHLDRQIWEYNDGNEIKPAVTVTYPTGATGGVTLNEGSDYTLVYHNNTTVGTANGIQGPYVEMIPKDGGRITGSSIYVPFTIKQVDISQCSINGVENSYLYTGSMIQPNSLVVKKTNGDVIDPSNYEVTYRTNASNPTMAPAGCTETITIKGKGNYTGYLTKEITITRRDLTNPAQATCTIEDQIYSARELTPGVVITFADENGQEKTLTAGTDYQVTGYFNNKNAKDKSAANAPYAAIEGINSCTGSLNVLFTINKRDMDSLVYSDVVNPQYVPGQTSYCPAVSVYMSAIDADSKLTEGTDYSVHYYNNTSVSAANEMAGPYMEITPRDTNNYTGSHLIFFSIEAKDINSADLVVSLADTVNSGFSSENRNYSFDANRNNYSPTPTITYKNGSVISQLADTDYTVTYESNTGIGTGYVVITGIGNYTGVRREAFTIGTLISKETVVVTGLSDQVYTGQDTTPKDLKVRYVNKTEYLEPQVHYTVKYYLDAACQNEASLENMQNAGRIYVAITGTADPSNGGYVGTVVLYYDITRKSLTSSDIEVRGNDDVDYTGSAVYPPNLQLIDKGTGLPINPMFYKVTYENNVEIGTASATITALDTGNYKDSITVYYRITKHNINNVVAEAIPDQRYTGGYIIPNLTLYDNGKRLVKGVDYDVVNGNNLRAGQSWVIIKGLGNYDQTKKVYFNIVASLETAIIDDIPDQLYTGNPVTPVERVACGGNTLVRGVDYTVSYANNTGVGDASITIRPLTQYYTGTIVKKFTITNSIAGATVTGIPASYLYTGEAFVPEPVVTFNGITLTKNVDYTVVYRNNVNVGTASVIISGMGKYSGTKTITFVITQKTITGCTIFMVASQNFTGKLITPPVVVKDGNRALTQGVDYQLSYSNNLDVGTGYITIVGRGDYQGTVTKEFKIVAQDPVENVLIQNRKEDAGTFDVLIDGAAVYVDNIRVEVWAKEDKSDIHSYDALRVDGDTFIAHVNAANHGHVSGTYQIAVYASGENYAEHPAFQSATAFQPVVPTNGNDQQGNQGNDQNQQDTTVVVIRPGVWHSSSSGWWYEYVDGAGGYVSSSWLELDGTWYYFDGSGYMLAGWQCINGAWYYFGNDGCMRTGWQMVDGTWYYMQDSGAMATGWKQIDGIWYYFNGDGSMATGWQQIGGNWYYMRDSGAMVTGWIRSGNTWYYMKDSGAMATGWQQIGGAWYYMYGSGAMATNTWIGRDYVSASGAWTTSR